MEQIRNKLLLNRKPLAFSKQQIQVSCEDSFTFEALFKINHYTVNMERGNDPSNIDGMWELYFDLMESISIVLKVNSNNGWETNRRAITTKCTLIQGYLLLHLMYRCCYIVLPCPKYLGILLLHFSFILCIRPAMFVIFIFLMFYVRDCGWKVAQS